MKLLSLSYFEVLRSAYRFADGLHSRYYCYRLSQMRGAFSQRFLLSIYLPPFSTCISCSPIGFLFLLLCSGTPHENPFHRTIKPSPDKERRTPRRTRMPSTYRWRGTASPLWRLLTCTAGDRGCIPFIPALIGCRTLQTYIGAQSVGNL